MDGDVPVVKSKKIEPVKNYIKVSVPNRIHMFTSRADFNVEGRTGGAGISINSNQVMEVKLVDENFNIDNGIFLYFCNIFKRLFEYNGHFMVCYKNKLPSHIGLGTTTSLTTALCWAINNLFGCPLSNYEIRKLIFDEYCEINDGNLIRGLGTGVGTVCSLYGGLNFVTNLHSFVHLEPSEELAVLTFIPLCKNFQKKIRLEEEHGQKEISFQADEETLLERENIIYHQFIPSLLAEKWGDLGKALLTIHTMGVKRIECARYDYEYEIELISKLLNQGVLLGGLSSLGPMNYMVTFKNKVSKFEKIIKESGFAVDIKAFDVCKYGIEILQMY